MKYASLLNASHASIDGGRTNFNIGDYIQFFALDYIYEEMGIDLSEITYLEFDKLGEYRGEQLVLPIAQCISIEFLKKLMQSKEYIIPVFISVCFYRNCQEMNDSIIDFLKKNAPIGCRDNVSLTLMKKNGIDAYLSGCITAVLPKRKNEGNTVYFVDVPKGYEKYIPKEYKENYKIVHHIQEIPAEITDATYARQVAKDLFDEYRRNAKIIITSRLHCASPAIAMGIPTVITRPYYGYTFTWIDQFVKVYTLKDRENVNWYPNGNEFAGCKEKIKEAAINRIKCAWYQNKCREVSNIYTKYANREDCRYEGLLPFERIKELVDEKFAQPKVKQTYMIWGVCDIAEQVYGYISENYPNMNLIGVIDTYRDIEFKGLKSVKPNVIQTNNDFLIVVTGSNAVNAAKECFERINKAENDYLLLCDVFM